MGQASGAPADALVRGDGHPRPPAAGQRPLGARGAEQSADVRVLGVQAQPLRERVLVLCGLRAAAGSSRLADSTSHRHVAEHDSPVATVWSESARVTLWLAECVTDRVTCGWQLCDSHIDIASLNSTPASFACQCLLLSPTRTQTKQVQVQKDPLLYHSAHI